MAHRNSIGSCDLTWPISDEYKTLLFGNYLENEEKLKSKIAKLEDDLKNRKSDKPHFQFGYYVFYTITDMI